MSTARFLELEVKQLYDAMLSLSAEMGTLTRQIEQLQAEKAQKAALYDKLATQRQAHLVELERFKTLSTSSSSSSSSSLTREGTSNNNIRCKGYNRVFPNRKALLETIVDRNRPVWIDLATIEKLLGGESNESLCEELVRANGQVRCEGQLGDPLSRTEMEQLVTKWGYVGRRRPIDELTTDELCSEYLIRSARQPKSFGPT